MVPGLLERGLSWRRDLQTAGSSASGTEALLEQPWCPSPPFHFTSLLPKLDLGAGVLSVFLVRCRLPFPPLSLKMMQPL